MNKFQKLFSRIHNFCIYSIFGFLASLINIACYWILRHLWHWQYLIANTLAWLVANIFGFLLINQSFLNQNIQISMLLFVNLLTFLHYAVYPSLLILG